MTSRRTLPGTLDALIQLPGIIARCAHIAGLSDKQEKALRLAADELITNSVLHGYEENDLEGEVFVDWSVNSSGALVLGIEDNGPLFDPTGKADPDHVNAPLHEKPIGGLGIMLARKAVDSLEYSVHDGRNRVELILAPQNPASLGASA